MVAWSDAMDRVLVLDQEGSLSNAVRDALHDSGYSVVLCADAAPSLALLQTE
jgi:DNA-binding response OmpR family regulator